MDVGQAIIDGTREVFSAMLMVELEVVKIIEGRGGDIPANITSMVGLGKDIRGMLAVHCPSSVARDITGTFLGMEVLEIDEDVKDAIGEIANMVAGNMKNSFAEDGKDIQIAIPTTVIGESFSTSGMSGATRVVVHFAMNGGLFMVELKYID
ncbi:putative inhibitor of MCP methylation, CheC [Desulfocapsa sulfexigens DSM 10523]|uniref:Putative inhibitor of MCP methylation, CheC n=1 Tax=Desulfocapsa sulfexigens (strain DSM 10523 / SB164P1) TaxID=1167006 RepID=M1PJ44_DESSD|nr:chemotaxis protein CheX [Desulfocapsa sulfexigens]AGF79595.1 putative inhibitor of MCP methylation, CheC [Desulfocapsa sulfexigens DSM 10523]